MGVERFWIHGKFWLRIVRFKQLSPEDRRSAYHGRRVSSLSFPIFDSRDGYLP
jgi:hypothetical protein